MFFLILHAGVIITATFCTLKLNKFTHRLLIFKIYFKFRRESPRPALNRLPRPYQGRALPAELQGHIKDTIVKQVYLILFCCQEFYQILNHFKFLKL